MRPTVAIAAAAGVLLHGLSAGSSGAPPPPPRWSQAGFEIQAQITHSSGTASPAGVTWDDAFLAAAQEWNSGSGDLVDVGVITNSFEDPCDTGDGENGVGFSAVPECGTSASWGSTLLAFARYSYTGVGYTNEGNVLFNASKDWDVYSGSYQSATPDFQRVAVHEIGHLLGLAHEDDVVAIMNSIVGDTTVPQSDDLSGIDAIYELGCPITQTGSVGEKTGSVATTDCTAFEVSLGVPALNTSQDPDADSFVDLYSITLDGTESFEAALFSSAFNPVVQLLDSSLSTEFEADSATSGNTASVTVANPTAGNYTLAVRSFFAGQGGPYTLTLVPEPDFPAPWALLVVALLATQHPKWGRGDTQSVASSPR